MQALSCLQVSPLVNAGFKDYISKLSETKLAWDCLDPSGLSKYSFTHKLPLGTHSYFGQMTQSVGFEVDTTSTKFVCREQVFSYKVETETPWSFTASRASRAN